MAQSGQAGMEHWRRAVRWTGAGIFAMALIGGLVGGWTTGNSAASPTRVTPWSSKLAS
jgi:hypothetical protein